MTNKEKLILLEVMLDIEEGTLNEEMELIDIEEWDSMAVISLIALFDEKFDKTVPMAKIKEFKCLKDVLEQMN